MSYQLPFITICIPTRNEQIYIEATLNMLFSQEYNRELYEIIVIDGCSDDATAQIVKRMQRKYPQLKLEYNFKLRASAGRNIGLQSGRGDIFLMIDGHCYIPDRQLFNNIVKCFDETGADCLGRPQPLSPPTISEFQRFVAGARSCRIGHASNSLIYSDFSGFVSPQSHGAIYKRKVIEKLGFFDESFDACEDVEFNFRVEQAGFKTYMHPCLFVKYYPRKNFRGLFCQMERYGEGRIKLMSKHHETFSLMGLIPFFFVSGLFINFAALFLSLSTKINMLIAVPYILYLIIVVLFSARLSKSVFSTSTLIYLMILLTIHVGLGIGQIKQTVSILKSKLLNHLKQLF